MCLWVRLYFRVDSAAWQERTSGSWTSGEHKGRPQNGRTWDPHIRSNDITSCKWPRWRHWQVLADTQEVWEASSHISSSSHISCYGTMMQWADSKEQINSYWKPIISKKNITIGICTMRVEMNWSHLSIQHYLQGGHREPDVTESPLDTKEKFVAFANTARGQQKPSSGQISSVFVKCMLGYRKKGVTRNPCS